MRHWNTATGTAMTPIINICIQTMRHRTNPTPTPTGTPPLPTATPTGRIYTTDMGIKASRQYRCCRQCSTQGRTGGSPAGPTCITGTFISTGLEGAGKRPDPVSRLLMRHAALLCRDLFVRKLRNASAYGGMFDYNRAHITRCIKIKQGILVQIARFCFQAPEPSAGNDRPPAHVPGKER